MAAATAMKVGELAKRTGLSVRTLHYYDEIGLLSPSQHTGAGHRLYGARDVARLQQILSLRQVGFSLDEIRECLKSPDFSLRQAIELHIARLKQQIELERGLCERLEAIVKSLCAAESVSVDKFIQTMEAMNRMEKYYTPEQLNQLKQRREQYGEEGIRQGERDWQALIDEVRAEMNAGTDPATERVQALAARWRELVGRFTGGDPGIAKSLNRMWKEEDTVHGFAAKEMREMMAYISKAHAGEQRTK